MEEHLLQTTYKQIFSLFKNNNRSTVNMKEAISVVQVDSLSGCLIFAVGGVLSFIYVQPSQGMLPVLAYSFRDNSPFLFLLTIFLAIIFLICTIIYEFKLNSE